MLGKFGVYGRCSRWKGRILTMTLSCCPIEGAEILLQLQKRRILERDFIEHVLNGMGWGDDTAPLDSKSAR